jgi:ribosome assembly protein 1
MLLAAACAPQEELREGSGAFLVHAYLPVEASFGLADEMRRRSSGAASASLLLSHWERLQVGWMN